ncbi:MAG TPA: HNH endonuclease [Puia sp.]|nr:HNH endonuclease [Puia sp.]
MSKTLNALPIFEERPDAEKFRNPNGVATKLSNFLPFDENYKGKGLDHNSKLDKELFQEFRTQKPRLHKIAQQIKLVVSNSDLKELIEAIEEDDESRDDSVLEGQILYRLHKVRERERKIVQRKKDQALAQSGKLICEACEFVFADFYGPLGVGFIECHHRVPLSQFKVEKRTALDDLALVCSNCHRMLHKKIDALSIEDLKMLVRYPR